MSSTQIAYITGRFPPMLSSGTFRVEAVVEHLPHHGYVPIVVTIPDSWVRHQAAIIGETCAPDVTVLRPTSRLDPTVQALSSMPVVRRLVREMMIPDVLTLWARRVVDDVLSDLEDCQLVYATSPPFSALVLADGVSRKLGIPLVQEIRDPPSFNRRLRGRRPSFIKRMSNFERRYLSSAEAVVTVTPGTRQHLLRLHPQLLPDHVTVIPNGYPEINVDPSTANRRADRFTISYVGTFQGGTRGRDESWFSPEIILPHLAGLPGNPEVRLVGQLMARQRRRLTSWGPMVNIVGQVSRQRAVSEIAAADVALILAEDESWWIGRKVYEYLTYAKRILAVVPPGDTADLLGRSSKSIVTHPGDHGSLEVALRRLCDEWLTGVIPSGEEPVIRSDRETVQDISRLISTVIDTSRVDR